MKDTFYVIRDELNAYRRVMPDLHPTRVPCLLSGVDRIEQATQFPYYSDAAVAIVRREERYGFSSKGFQIVRVTRTTTPGTQMRRVLDHGEAAPAGATILFALVNPFGIHGSGHGRDSNGELSWAASMPDGLELFVNEKQALNQLRALPGHYFTIRRVALTATEPTVEYKEEVVS